MAAERDRWPPGLAFVTDWGLMSLEQEAELASLAFDRRNWGLLGKMLDCGVGAHCVRALLTRCADGVAADGGGREPGGGSWPEFAEELFKTQVPGERHHSDDSRRGVRLDLGHLSQLLEVCLGARDRFWDYVPDLVQMLFDRLRLRRRSSEIEKRFRASLAQTDLFVTSEEEESPSCPLQLARKWRIVLKVLEHLPPLRGRFLHDLWRPGTTNSEAKALVRDAVQHRDVSMGVLCELEDVVPELVVFIEEQLQHMSVSTLATVLGTRTD